MAERINFSSLNATRGAPKPKMAGDLSPADIAARDTRSAEYQAKLQARLAAKAPPAYTPAPSGERLNFQSLNAKNTTRSAPPMLPGEGGAPPDGTPSMSDTTPRYVPEDPNERAAMRTRQAVQHHGGPTTGMGAELPFLIQHYYDNAMAGPRAMERIAHGELDPMSPEGIRTGMSAAWSLPMQSPFVPRGSVGVGGGRMSQPPFEPNVYGKSEHTYTPGANENMPGGGPGISQAELDASMERLNQALAPYNARDKFRAIEGGASPVARYVPDKT